MRIQVRDVKLFFDVEGTKLRPVGTRMQAVPTLLLLHGGPGSDHSEFKLGFSQLADIPQVIYLDHRGNGRSDRGLATVGILRPGQMMYERFAMYSKLIGPSFWDILSAALWLCSTRHGIQIILPS